MYHLAFDDVPRPATIYKKEEIAKFKKNHFNIDIHTYNRLIWLDIINDHKHQSATLKVLI